MRPAQDEANVVAQDELVCIDPGQDICARHARQQAQDTPCYRSYSKILHIPSLYPLVDRLSLVDYLSPPHFDSHYIKNMAVM